MLSACRCCSGNAPWCIATLSCARAAQACKGFYPPGNTDRVTFHISGNDYKKHIAPENGFIIGEAINVYIRSAIATRMMLDRAAHS